MAETKKSAFTQEQEDLYSLYLEHQNDYYMKKLKDLQQIESKSEQDQKDIKEIEKYFKENEEFKTKTAELEQQIQNLEQQENPDKKELGKAKKSLQKLVGQKHNTKRFKIIDLEKQKSEGKLNHLYQWKEEQSKKPVVQEGNSSQQGKQDKKQKNAFTPEQEELYSQYLQNKQQKQQERLDQLNKNDNLSDQEKKELKEINLAIKNEKEEEEKISTLEQKVAELEAQEDPDKKELGKAKKGLQKLHGQKHNTKRFKILELEKLKSEGKLNTPQPSKPQQQTPILTNQTKSVKIEQQQQQQQKPPKPTNNNNQNKKNKQQQSQGQMPAPRLERAGSVLPDHLQAPSFQKATSTPSSKQIVDQKQFNNTHFSEDIHFAILSLGLLFSQDKIIGSNQRCIQYLTAICKVIQDIKIVDNQQQQPKLDEFPTLLGEILDDITEKMQYFRSLTEGMKTANIFAKRLKSILQNSVRDNQIDIQTQKDWFCDQIQNFIDIKIRKADQQIIKNGQSLIKDGDVIMVYARSMVIEQLFKKALQQGINFSVIIVDNSPFFEGKQLLKSLSEVGIDCMYTLLTQASYFIKKVTKVFVGASTMLSNGALVARVGTASLACIVNDFRKPFHVFCESYKFSDKSYLDSLSWNNELADEGRIDQQSSISQSLQQFKSINLRYDVTPCENINMLITEYGKVPPHSVPHIIREFSKYDQVGKIDLPENYIK